MGARGLAGHGNGGRPGGIVPGQMTVGGRRGVQVIIDQAIHGGVALGHVIRLGESAGVFPDGIVETVPARNGLVDQMVRAKFIEQGLDGGEVALVQGRGGAGVDIGTRRETEPPKEPLLVGGQLPIGQIEGPR